MSRFKLNRRVTELSRRISDPRVAQVSLVTTDGDMPVVETYQPTPAERKLLEKLFDPKFMTASISDICKAAGVSRETYYQSVKKPGFVASIKAYALDATKGKAPRYVALAEKFAEEGSWPHLRALLAMSGVYDEKITIEAEPVRAVMRPKAEPQQ